MINFYFFFFFFFQAEDGIRDVAVTGVQTCALPIFRVKFGFGRRNAVISCAFDSSIPICPARKVGFAASNLSRTSCQVSAFWAKPLSAKTAVANNPTHRRLKKRFMKPPRTFLAAPETQRLSNATGGGAPLRVGESVIDDVCPALRK